MMPLKENSTNTENNKSKDSEALKTEEILSLLSKTRQDFIKDSELSDNISTMFKKKTLTDLAQKKAEELKKKTEEKNLNNNDLEKNEIKSNEEKDTKSEEEKKALEKKYTEAEAKKIANDLAKDYYNKGYHLGVKKTKDELEKGEKALAVTFKNVTDNIFSLTPELSKKLMESFNKNILNIVNQIVGYEIDSKTEFFLDKINKLKDMLDDSTKKTKIFLSEPDHKAITSFLNESKIEIDFEIKADKKIERGDIKIKSGSIEVAEIIKNKIKISQTDNIDDELLILEKNIEEPNDIKPKNNPEKETDKKNIINKTNNLKKDVTSQSNS